MSYQLNLSERDIEEWIHSEPAMLKVGIVGWIGRQYQLPSGIADLIGYAKDRYAVVVEVKNVPINKAALAQVSRYAGDVAEIASWKEGYAEWSTGSPYVGKVLVGPSIDRQTLIEAEAMNIVVILFEATLTLTMTSTNTPDRLTRQAVAASMADREEWSVFDHKDAEP